MKTLAIVKTPARQEKLDKLRPVLLERAGLTHIPDTKIVDMALDHMCYCVDNGKPIALRTGFVEKV